MYEIETIHKLELDNKAIKKDKLVELFQAVADPF